MPVALLPAGQLGRRTLDDLSRAAAAAVNAALDPRKVPG
jgi:hypothetical protein